MYRMLLDPPGVYNVVASGGWTFENAQAANVTIALGAVATQDFVLVKAAPGTVVGVVTEITNAPIPGAIVSVLDPYEASVEASTSADAAGKYSLTVLSGARTLAAGAPPSYRPAQQNLNVIAGKTTTVNFSLTSVPTTAQNGGKPIDHDAPTGG
jgi:hypothetical protein